LHLSRRKHKLISKDFVISTATPSWDDLHEVANAQSGHVTAQQASDVGFSVQLLHKHVATGNLERVERGIYRIARFPPSDNENLVVVWLWSNRQAVFSHETAMQLHDLSDALPARVHMTLPLATSRRRKRPEGAVIHHADLPDTDRQWLGPVPITRPARTVLYVAAAHGDAALVAQAIDKGIRNDLFTFEQVANAGRYVANAQGWGTPIRPRGMSHSDGSEVGEDFASRFYSRPISGTCNKRPPADWPTQAVELGQEAGARLRVAQYLPSRAMFLEFAWRIDKMPEERAVTRLRKRLAKRFSWA